MDFIEDHPILFIVLLVAGIGFLAHLGVTYIESKDQHIRETTPCQEYASSELQHIPVRCYNELKINKGCFHVEEHWVQTGKTGHMEYSVTPLCG